MKADKRPWKHLRLVQNLLIAALSLSALLLLLQVASYEMGLDGSIASLPSQFSPPAATDQSPQHSTDLTGLTFPRSLMVTGDYGRSGHLLITEEDAGARRQPPCCGRPLAPPAAARRWTRPPSARPWTGRIYFDFIQTMPVSVLSGQYGGLLPPPVPGQLPAAVGGGGGRGAALLLGRVRRRPALQHRRVRRRRLRGHRLL